jgi:EthD domain
MVYGMDGSSGGPSPDRTAAERQLGPVKLFEFLRTPRESAERRQHQRWAEERSSLISQRDELAQHARAHDLYERLPATGSGIADSEGVPDSGFEAVSVQWFDSHRAYEAMLSAPGADELKKLDQRFWQEPMPSVLTGPPDVILGPPGGVPDSGASLICILRHAPGMDLAFFHDHWLRHHGGLFQTILELREPMLGYEQNHGIQGASAAYDGVTQQWFSSLETFETSTQVPAFSGLVTPDTAYFLDADHLHFIMAGPPTRVFG